MSLLIADMKDALDRLAKLPTRAPPLHSKRKSTKKTSKPHNKLPVRHDRGPRKLPEPAKFVPRTEPTET